MSTALGALILVVSTLFIVPVIAAQPSPTVRIGVLSPLSPSAVSSPPFEALRRALHDLGYVEGRNATFVYRWADNSRERLGTFATELVDLKVDVCLLYTSPSPR